MKHCRQKVSVMLASHKVLQDRLKSSQESNWLGLITIFVKQLNLTGKLNHNSNRPISDSGRFPGDASFRSEVRFEWTEKYRVKLALAVDPCWRSDSVLCLNLKVESPFNDVCQVQNVGLSLHTAIFRAWHY